MSSDYFTLRGTSRRKEPTPDIYSLPNREAPDDGAIVLGVSPLICSDCGRGRLIWAEAGYVPWHRICECCGSHWDEHPVDYYLEPVPAEEPRDLPPSKREQVGWLIRTSRFREPAGPVSDLEGAPLHSSLMALITRDHCVAAATEAPGRGAPVIHAAWATRARLYRRG